MKAKLKIVILNVVPIIIIELILLPFWISGSGIKTNFAIAQFLIMLGILPVYLAIVNFVLSIKYSNPYWGAKSFSIASAIFVGTLLGYVNWGLSSKHLFNPDGETIEVVKFEIAASLIIAFILFFVSNLIATIFIKKKLRNL